PPQDKTKTYVHLMRAAHDLFEAPELSRLAPRVRATPAANGNGHAAPADPLVRHENIAYDWMGQGGKRSRPFITLAAYDALKGAPGTRNADGVTLPDAVKRVALAIEAFHKASLVHDDIEDDDTFRYGRETLHRQYGVGTAINVGDYLIGLGYRLVARERKDLGGDCAADGDNKLVAGGDVLAARPTLLLALALEGLPPAEREELLALLRRDRAQDEVIAHVGRLFTKAQVFAKAEKLVEKFRAKAEGIADE